MRNRIIFTLDCFELGGVARFTKQYVNVLAKNGIDSTIIGFKGNIENPRLYFGAKTRIVEIGNVISAKYIEKFIELVLYNYYLTKEYILSKPVAIHMSTSWSTFYTILNPLTWFRRKTITFYGAFDLEIKSFSQKHNLFFPIESNFRYLLQKLGLIISNKIIVFSEYSKELLFQHFSDSFAKKCVIIPATVPDTQVYRNFKPKFKVEKESTTILNIGRAEPRKGINLLFETLKVLNSNYEERKFKLIIASPVSYLQRFGIMDYYEKLNLFDSVSFVHIVNDEQKDKLFNKSDLFVIPSLDLETFGYTILESFVKGVLVVGTPAGAIPETLNKIEPRLVSKKVSASSLAKTVVWVTGLSLQEKEKIVRKSKLVIKKYYSDSVVSHLILKTLGFNN